MPTNTLQRAPRSNSSAAALVLALGVTGALAACGPPTSYTVDGGTTDGGDASTMPMGDDPRGTDATFNFSWRINGVNPTDASNPCGAANIRYIRMSVVDANMTEHTYDQFRFDCRLGAYRSSTAEMRAGRYRIFWEAVDTMGARVSLASGTLDAMGNVVPALQEITVAAGDHLDFDSTNRPDATFMGAPTNFSTASAPFQTGLRFGRMAGDTAGASCAEAGVANVEYTLRLSNNVPLPAAMGMPAPGMRVACSAMLDTLRWAALNYDSYGLDVKGFNAAGAMQWSGRCTHLLSVGSAGPFTCVTPRTP